MTSLLVPTISPGNRVDSDDRERPTASVGIDTIKVGGRLTKRPDLSVFETTTQHDYGASGERFASAGWTFLDGVKFVAKTNHYGLGPYALWEVSLPTAEHGHNLHSMPLPEALAALSRTYELGSELVEWAVPFEDLSIKRLDSDRDFTAIEDIPGDARASRVPLSDIPAKALRDHREAQPGGPDDYVFTAPRGGPVRLGNFRKRIWYKAVASAGVAPGFDIHDMRHTAISLWIAAGIDVLQMSTFAEK
jgi:hypothetical protein